MNENGFTGLNVERVESDIRKFDELAVGFAIHVGGAFGDLYTFLNNHWASPVAAEFTSKNVEDVRDLVQKITTTVHHIEHGAIEAARSLAKANGTTIELDDLYAANICPGDTGIYHVFEPCRESLNGETGMDVEGVRNALAIFQTAILACLDEIDTIPEGIAFYDPNGDLISEYKRGISNFKKEISDLAGKTYQKLNQFLFTESDNVKMAKQQATQALNG